MISSYRIHNNSISITLTCYLRQVLFQDSLIIKQVMEDGLKTYRNARTNNKKEF